MRLIDADALEKRMYVIPYYDNRDEDSVIDEIYKAPTAEAVPVVRGEWKQHLEPYLDWVKYKQECSECHEAVPGVTGPNFCPNCGADNRGSEATQ